jgi:hypothetical protein
MAGGAPLGPEIHEDRVLVGGVDDSGLELLVIDVERMDAGGMVVLERHDEGLDDENANAR